MSAQVVKVASYKQLKPGLGKRSQIGASSYILYDTADQSRARHSHLRIPGKTLRLLSLVEFCFLSPLQHYLCLHPLMFVTHFVTPGALFPVCPLLWTWGFFTISLEHFSFPLLSRGEPAPRVASRVFPLSAA